MLTACLDSVEAAAAVAREIAIELIVVDNGSTDDTWATLQQWAERSSLPTICVREERAGLAIARNTGLRAATADLIAFTDDDCRLDKDYFLDLADHFSRDRELTFRGGRVELGDPRDLPMTIKTADEVCDFRHPMSPGGFIHGANMATSRAVVQKVGMFDERFGAGTRYGGEDTDYYIRAHALGVRVQYVPNMTVYHYHGRRDLSDARELYASHMRATGALYVKHLRSSPQLIRQFWWDLRAWGREIQGGRRRAASELDFGMRPVVVGKALGMISFAMSLVWGKLGLHRRKTASL